MFHKFVTITNNQISRGLLTTEYTKVNPDSYLYKENMHLNTIMIMS